MRLRRHVSVFMAVVIVGVIRPGVNATGQEPSIARRTATESSWVPRTSWGAPDLQGVWDFRTVTPLERPEHLAGKLVLTVEEAAKVEAAAAGNRVDRTPRAGDTGTYNQFWFDSGTKVVKGRRSSLIVDPPDGRILPLTSEAQARRDALREVRRGVDPDAPTPGGWLDDLGPGGLRVRCILGFNSGPPMTPSAYNNNVQMFQTPGYVALLNEVIHDTRIIPLDGRPHGTLRWTRPWMVQIPMIRSDQPVYEYACHEGNYSLYNILAGAHASKGSGTKTP